MTDRASELADGGGQDATPPDRELPTSHSGWRELVEVVRSIARAQRRRHGYRYTATRRKRALILFGVALTLPVLGGVLRVAHDLGRRIGAGELPELIHLTMWSLPAMAGTYFTLAVVDSGSQWCDFEARELLLTTVPERPLFFGLLASECQSWFVFFIGPSSLVVLTFALGAGSLVTAVVGIVAMAGVTVLALLWGTVVGAAGRLLWHRFLRISVPTTFLRVLGMTTLGLLFGLGGVFAGSLSARLEGGLSIAAVAPAGPPPVPLGHYAEVFFYGTPHVTSLSTAAVASALVVAVSIPIGVGVLATLVPRLWYLDTGVQPDAADGRADAAARSETDRCPGRDWPWQRLAVGYVAGEVIRRTIRTPGKLIHLVYYVLVVGIIVAASAVDPSVLPRQLGWAAVLLGVWLAGGVVGLNPIGEEGPMLDQIVLAKYPARTFVRARIAAGTAIGTPFVLAGAVLLSLADFPTMAAVALGGIWVALPVSAAIAVGVGTLLPRTEPGRTFNVRAQTPETLAVLVHGGVTALFVVAGGLIVVDFASRSVDFVALGALLLVALLVADLCYRFAVSGISGYGTTTQPDAVYTLEIATLVTVVGLALSVTVPSGVRSIGSSAEPVATPLTSVAWSVGWVVAGVGYLLAADRSLSVLEIGSPDRDVLRTAGLGVVASVVAAAGVLAVADPPRAAFAVTSHVLLGPLGVGTVLLGVGTAVAHAVGLEFLFRSVVQKRLSEAISSGAATLATAVLFAVAQAPAALTIGQSPVLFASLSFGFGLLWGWLYDRSGSLLAVILCHSSVGVIFLTA